jgi:hypothetical protein
MREERDGMHRAEDRPGRTPARALRGALAASSATLVALASHLAAGGGMPAPAGIAVPLALSLPVCMAWAGRRPSLPRLSASVLASQLFFHVLFVLGTPAAPASSGSHPHGGHAGHAGTVMPTTTAHTGQLTEMAHADASMWVWHAIAAVTTIVVLHRGELLVLRLRELAAQAAAWLLRGWTITRTVGSFVAPARPVVLAAIFRPVHPGPQLSPLRRRGPPAPHAV